MQTQHSLIKLATVLMLTGALVGVPASPASAFGKKKDESPSYTHPQRNFLPPVATINPIIKPDTLDEDGVDEVVMMPAVTPTVLKTSPKVTKLDNDLGIKTSTDEHQQLLEMQRTLDNEDLDRLWKATVERNPVIRFSLEKIHAPQELHKKQSSLFMRKSLNALITGATMATTLIPGGGSYRNMGAMALGDATRNMTVGPPTVSDNILSATEKIQLAGLVDELQSTVIQTYHDYKTTLQTLASAHQSTVQSNVRYSKAMDSNNNIAILASGTAYYKALMEETSLRQKAKLHRLKLERLAGPEAVSELKLTVAFSQDLMEQAGLSQRKPEETALATPAKDVTQKPDEPVVQIPAKDAISSTPQSKPTTQNVTAPEPLPYALMEVVSDPLPRGE